MLKLDLQVMLACVSHKDGSLAFVLKSEHRISKEGSYLDEHT